MSLAASTTTGLLRFILRSQLIDNIDYYFCIWRSQGEGRVNFWAFHSLVELTKQRPSFLLFSEENFRNYEKIPASLGCASLSKISTGVSTTKRTTKRFRCFIRHKLNNENLAKTGLILSPAASILSHPKLITEIFSTLKTGANNGAY